MRWRATRDATAICRYNIVVKGFGTARYQKEGITTTSQTDKDIKSDQHTLWPCPPVRTVPVGVGAAHVAPLMRGDLAGPQMKQSGAASTSKAKWQRSERLR